MSIESVLHSIIQPVFGDEVYPVVHPDPDGTEAEVAALYAIYFKVGGQTFSSLDGTGTLSRVRFQISIYGIDFNEVGAKEISLKAAMKTANDIADEAIDERKDPLTTPGALSNILMSVPSDGYEKDTKRYVKRLEYYCWMRD